ncbi:MAG TPA: hypothetical protein VFK96_03350 [Gammaproteobacteria bacterium]|nr:hypothetical protein [Gammaproteobacteria bacterium]
MMAFEICLIAAFFPIFGMSALQALRIREATWATASAFGFTGILLIGALFYDFGAYEFFVPSVVCLLVVCLLASAASGNFIAPIEKPDGRFLLCLLSFGFTALMGRIPVSNFIFEIGDAGAYVNSANHLASAGTSTAQFFPLNQVLLGVFSFIGGAALTPYGVLFASMASAWFAVLLGRAYFGSWRAGWLVGIIVSLNVLAMWFGRLPYSESLMLAANLGALAYWKFAVDTGPTYYRYYVLFGLFVAVASLTRVTGIIWMLVLSGVLLFLCSRRSERVKPFVLAFLIAAAGYILSVQIALSLGQNYYINWQLRSFLPWLKTSDAVILFHLVWAIGLVTLATALFKLSPWIRFPAWIKTRTGLWTFLGFIGFLFLTTLHFVDDWHHWLIIGAASRLAAGHFPEDSYYLGHYFTILAIPLFFAGWYFLFRKRDPFKDESWAVFWLFSALFLMISYIRPTYGNSHDVYMYWDRYFLSDTFIVFVVVISAGAIWCFRTKFTRWFALAFLGVYVAQAAVWMGINADSKYLSEGYEMIAWLESSIPRSNSVLFLDDQYEARWVFPNLRRTILTPLSHSFGYDVKGAGVQPGPFSQDAPLSYAAVNEALTNGKQAYIIFASTGGQYQRLHKQPLPIDVIARRSFVVTAKPSLQGRVFAGGKKGYPIALTIGRVWSNQINIKASAHTGVYGDNVWTDGDARFYSLDICPPEQHQRVIIRMYGYIPRSVETGEINLRVFANDMPLPGTWRSRTSYVAKLPEHIGCIHTLQFKSNTFIPKKLGINSDTRRLGIDLKSIIVE